MACSPLSRLVLNYFEQGRGMGTWEGVHRVEEGPEEEISSRRLADGALRQLEGWRPMARLTVCPKATGG